MTDEPTRRAVITLADLMEIFQRSSFGGPGQSRAWLDKETGKTWLVTDDDFIDEELPDDIDTADKYVRLPDINDLELGRDLVFRFMDEVLPGEAAEVERSFHRRGAYGRFKSLLQSRGMLDCWHAYQDSATEAALRGWCAENGIRLAEP